MPTTKKQVRTADIIPVDLNSFLCKNAKILSDLFARFSLFPLFLQFSFSSLLIGWRTKQSQQNMKGSTKVCETPFMLSSILTICGMTSTLSQGISNWKTRTNNICLRKSTTRQHTGGFYPSNLAPLYSDCIPASLDLGMVVVEIAKLNDTLGQPGGLPSSTIESR